MDIGDDPVLQALMNLSQGVVVEYETNEYGDVVAVRNWEEIARLMQQSLEMVAGMLRDAGLSEAEIAEMEALISPMFASQEQVEAFAMESIQLYHLAYGWSPLEQGSPIIYDSQLPNPFGGEPFPALGELALINGDFGEGVVLLHWKQSVDPQFVRQIMMQTLVDMAMWMGNDPPTESDLPDPFVVEDYAEIVFDVESSWNRSLYYVRKIEVGTSLRTDSKHFIDLTYSPR
ncbi:MAG: hypothetical protein M9928_14370 [Anaerolineae bacterium]|nr:hypothetical protein [Anaerolineae bacterium]